MTVRSTPSFLQAGSHPAEEVRLMVQGLLASQLGSFAGGVSAVDPGHGVCHPDDLEVTEKGTPDMSVDVALGMAFIRGTQSANQGVYHLVNDASINLPLAAADSTNPRIDLVIAQVRDSAYSGADDDARITVVTGTPAASPSDPSLSSYPNALVLARVEVGASVSSVTDSDITDLRTHARTSWNSAWGTVPHSGTPSSFSFNNTEDDSGNFTFPAVAGRRYRVTVAGEFANGSVTGVVDTLSVETSGGTTIYDPVARFTPGGANAQDIRTGVFTWDASSTGTQTWRLSAVASTSSTTQTFTPFTLIIEDIGPAV